MENKYIIEIENLCVDYPKSGSVVTDFSMKFATNTVTVLIGPEGGGKTSVLRSINRMHELYPEIKVSGNLFLNGKNIMDMNVIEVRRNIGMVFKEPNPFPNSSIYNNVLAGYRINKILPGKKEKDRIVQESLQAVGIWDEVKNQLNNSPEKLSPSARQCLCIARTIALRPKVILMDEPICEIDTAYKLKIENLIVILKEYCTIIMTTNNLSFAARISDHIVFMEEGRLIEHGKTAKLFWNPNDPRTEKYITGNA